MELYAAYLEECTNLESTIKLSTEIGRLNEQNKVIDKMNFEAVKLDIHDYQIEVPGVL